MASIRTIRRGDKNISRIGGGDRGENGQKKTQDDLGLIFGCEKGSAGRGNPPTKPAAEAKGSAGSKDGKRTGCLDHCVSKTSGSHITGN